MEIDLEKSGELSVWIRTRSITGKLGERNGKYQRREADDTIPVKGD